MTLHEFLVQWFCTGWQECCLFLVFIIHFTQFCHPLSGERVHSNKYPGHLPSLPSYPCCTILALVFEMVRVRTAGINIHGKFNPRYYITDIHYAYTMGCLLQVVWNRFSCYFQPCLHTNDIIILSPNFTLF